MANVASLLYGSADKVDLLSQLEPRAQELVKLNDGKRKIREHLRATFSALDKSITGNVLRPRFFTQGSAAYKTLNRPAHLPPQQMDLDDGTYLPMSKIQDAPKPSIAAVAFFNIVDSSLKELERKEGWTFEEKPTCGRLVISDDAHIDVPLYAIPDKQFETLVERARLQKFIGEDNEVDFMEASRSGDNWHLLPSDKVLLAHREEDWVPSDPRLLHAWFLGSVDHYGEQLRRECRYIKAWRDQQHPRLKNLSSILLMTCVWNVYNDMSQSLPPKRDDIALMKIADRLPVMLAGPIINETDKMERLDSRLTDEERRDAIALATSLSQVMNSTIQHCYDPEVAVRNLRQVLGSRIPMRPDLVRIEGPAKEVLKVAPAVVPAPEVRRSRSG